MLWSVAITLTDILGAEDAFGDMTSSLHRDFVTALQRQHRS